MDLNDQEFQGLMYDYSLESIYLEIAIKLNFTGDKAEALDRILVNEKGEKATNLYKFVDMLHNDPINITSEERCDFLLSFLNQYIKDESDITTAYEFIKNEVDKVEHLADGRIARVIGLLQEVPKTPLIFFLLTLE